MEAFAELEEEAEELCYSKFDKQRFVTTGMGEQLDASTGVSGHGQLDKLTGTDGQLVESTVFEALFSHQLQRQGMILALQLAARRFHQLHRRRDSASNDR